MPRPNDIVWRVLDGKLVPAVVHFARERTLEVVGPDGATQTLAPRRVVHVSDRPLKVSPADRGAAARALAKWQAEVESAAASVSLGTLWELFVEEDAGSTTLEDLAELGLGEGTGAARDALALALHDDPIYFKARKEGWVPNPRRTVEELERQRARQREEEEAVTRLARALAGEDDDEAVLREALDLLLQIALNGDEAPAFRRGCLVLEQSGLRDRGDVAFVAFRQLVERGELDPHEDLNLRRHRLGRPFAEETLAEADAVARAGVVLAPDRQVDLRALPTVAIDESHTTEVDDALAVELGEDGGATVHVLIADAGTYIPHLGAVDEEARRRGATLYHPTERFFMLPPALAEGVASLAEGEDRCAIDFAVDLGADGAPRGIQVREAVIRVDRRMTYDAVDAMLAGGEVADADRPLTALVESLNRFAAARRAFREAAGALVFGRRETQVRVVDGEICLSQSDSSTLSHRIVSEMMILACAEAAGWCHARGVPAVYRHQPPPDEPFTWDPTKRDDPLAVDAALRRMKRAELSLQPKRHSSLAVDAYTQVTSPLRRYQDLVMHRQLRAAVRGEAPPYGEVELMAIFAEVDATAALHNGVERDAQRYWALELLRSTGQRDVDVMVRREVGKRYLVELADYGLTAMFSPRGRVELGDSLRLQISDLSPRRDRLVLHE